MSATPSGMANEVCKKKPGVNQPYAPSTKYSSPIPQVNTFAGAVFEAYHPA